jgi:hypothetical protein
MDDPTIPTFTWQTIKTGLDGPGPRSRHGLVYDRGAGATVLFGGLIWVGDGPVQSDTWELKDGHWSEVKLVNHPPGRHRGAMVFDAYRGVTILFGGQADNGGMFGGTWNYTRRRWRKRQTWWRRSPEPRAGHSMAYDEPTRRTVLFGGVGRGDRTLGDTWLFDGGSWREVDGPHPQSRRYAAFAYDPGLQGCVLHGGSVDDLGRQQFGDAWIFRDRTWTRLPAGFKNDVRDDHGLAYHRSAGRLVMLDGIRSTRGLMVSSPGGWQPAWCGPLHPRHQCSPLAWDDDIDGLVLHGGEVCHGGHQFDATLVLRLTSAPENRR